jgi:tetratricopeptide (TPR) repeat protein
MEEISMSRIKSAMIIYEFERSLARYVRDKGLDFLKTAPAKEIMARVFGSDQENSRAIDIELILENSYISEALQLAEIASSNSSHANHFKKLRIFCDALEIFDIRNAVSHPNRQFPDCYWYRCCALASDPVIGLLGLLEVSNALGSALAGKLEEPPEDWLSKPRWTVPALLPQSFEHSSTGLIGRRKESEALLKELKNPRSPLISVVARGGIGKTSLVLQVLSDFCISTESANYFDGVVFVSLKTERLTSTGIESLAAPQSISDLCTALLIQLDDLYGEDSNNFEQAIFSYQDKRTCVFVDNLETLLRDEPKQFIDLYEALPAKWKVIVTSRIPLDGGKNMPLSPLDEGGAIGLARGYFISKGMVAPHPETVERLTSLCDRNPLAIRLSIDRYASGGELDNSAYDVQKDVISFSFSSLIEVLSEQANKTLEALFVLEESNRASLCDALSIDIDDISIAISELARTSLIVRRDGDDGEQYSLCASIRELLRASPRSLAVRGAIISWVARSKATVSEAMRAQDKKKLSPMHAFFIPPNTPASIIAISREVRGACRRKDFKTLSTIDVRIRQLIEEKPQNSFARRLHGRVLSTMQDHIEAERAFRAAAALDPNDPAPVTLLCALLIKGGIYDEAESLLKELIDKGWGTYEKSGEDCQRVWSIYLQTLNWQDKLDEAFSCTQDWKSSGLLETVFGIARIQSYRRQADKEKQNGADGKRIWSLISNGLLAIDNIIRRSGYSHLLNAEVKKTLGDIGYYSRRQNIDSSAHQGVKDLIAFINTHSNALREICPEELSEILKWIESSNNFPVEISKDMEFRPTSFDIDEKISKFENAGYIIVTIHHVPKTDGYPHFLFAFDGNEQRYYLNQNSFEGGNTKRWVQLMKGSRVAIKFTPGKPGRAPVANEILYVS